MIVLDSSAVLAVLFREPGAVRVQASFGEAVISAASLTEVLTKAIQRGIPSTAAYPAFQDFGIRVMPVDVIQARIAAEISQAPRELDLSLGDRLCLALAIVLDCELITSDRGIEGFKAGIPITLFR